MGVIFDATFPVHYGQAYVLSPPVDVNSDLEPAFVGQENGLLGAAVPGQLWLTTGLHTGRVGLRIEVFDAEPPLGSSWEEIVEVSYLPSSTGAALTGWGGEAEPVPLGLEVASHRVRLCASKMDEARQRDTILDGEDVIDRYQLALWKSDPRPDRVIRQTSATAAYWHTWAQALRRS